MEHRLWMNHRQREGKKVQSQIQKWQRKPHVEDLVDLQVERFQRDFWSKLYGRKIGLNFLILFLYSYSFRAYCQVNLDFSDDRFWMVRRQITWLLINCVFRGFCTLSDIEMFPIIMILFYIVTAITFCCALLYSGSLKNIGFLWIIFIFVIEIYDFLVNNIFKNRISNV